VGKWTGALDASGAPDAVAVNSAERTLAVAAVEEHGLLTLEAG
jgi:hypothetical protein